LFKLIKWSLILLITCTVIVSSSLYFLIDKNINQVLIVAQPQTLQIRTGQSSFNLLRDLEKTGVIKSRFFGRVWLKLNPEKSNIKAGYYDIARDETLVSLFDKLVAGRQKQYQVTLVEGLTFEQWRSVLRSTEYLEYDLDDPSELYNRLILINNFCSNSALSLEGCLLADTYAYTRNDSASKIIERAYLALGDFLPDVWEQRFQDIALESVYELLIMASIIEKETAVAQERGLISGVFNNRLGANMRLQTDPTVIYGIGRDFDGNLTRKHLRQPTPYNTYVIKGLPITPIAMSGKASLMAAARPELTDYIYFVAKGDGSHQFSVTLAEHNEAVRTYQLRRRN